MHETDSSFGGAEAVVEHPERDRQAVGVARLVSARNSAEIEHLADELSASRTGHWTGSVRGDFIEALMQCLTGDSIREDADAEDAVCSALEQIGVMSRVGNLVFEFVPESELTPADLAVVARYRDWLPAKYVRSRTPVQEMAPWSTE